VSNLKLLNKMLRLKGMKISLYWFKNRDKELHLSVKPYKSLLGSSKGTSIARLLVFGGIMATEALERLRSEMMALSETERAELAHELIQSLDAPRDNGVEEAWDREILRRISVVDDGQATLLDREEFRRRMRARFGAQ
jgi:putative addiction module component (TIGR02574 family)